LVRIEGFEDLLRRVVREELAAALDGAQPSSGWLTSRQAAAYLGIGVSSLHNLVSSGRLSRRGARGTALRFNRADLDQYVESRSDDEPGRTG
jgi:excisionase family DNA binding protein